jgi:GDPmannose 4,6-dehydratase
MTRKALITGINGQDGSYLAELLLKEGYQVVGTVRPHRSDQGDSGDLSRIPEGAEVIESELDGSIEKVIDRLRPDEIYNLAARASSAELWAEPIATGEVNALAVVRLLDIIYRVDRRIRFVQASSSEIFGSTSEVPQKESTLLQPRNPYGVAKAFGYWMTSVYRQQRGLFASSCILYNHESPRRGKELVTRKISHTVAMIKLGLAKELQLGDLNARRDWGFAGDYVRAMWLMLQQVVPDDYILATGETHSVREFCEIAFAHAGLKYEDYVTQDPENFRSPDTTLLVGDPSKARKNLGWHPTVSFKELVVMMVEADLKALEGAPERTPFNLREIDDI